MNVLLDTGSADLWVATTACQACRNDTPKFNMAQSSTLVATSQAFTFSYADHSSASGNLVQDTVAIGPYAVHSQSFAGVTSISGVVVSLGSNAGILGLAFQNIAVSGASPLWETLIAAGELSSPEMSFYIRRYASIATSPTQLDPGGTFTLGGTNSSFFKGDIEFNAFPPHVIPSAWMQLVSGELCCFGSCNLSISNLAFNDRDDCQRPAGGPCERAEQLRNHRHWHLASRGSRGRC